MLIQQSLTRTRGNLPITSMPRNDFTTLHETGPVQKAAHAAVRLAFLLLIPMIGGGCAVPQRSGEGQTFRELGNETERPYFLYLPRGYKSTGRAYPVVVSYHGLSPFDSASAQVKEWQQEADRYGFIVVVPVLKSAQFGHPLRPPRISNPFLIDEAVTLEVLDHVFKTTNSDRQHVLATSWSYGGYMAHFIINRHPELFSALAVRQSGFSDDLLDPSRASTYQRIPIGIFCTENDFAQCRRESQQAAVWYAQRGFDVTLAQFASLGHQRTPGPAAAFFARHCQRPANTPPDELAFLQVDSPPHLRDFIAKNAGKVPVPTSRPAVQPGNSLDPTTRTGEVQDTLPASPIVSLYVEPSIDVAPAVVHFRANVAPEWREGAHFLWLLNEQPLGNSVAGSKIFTEAGEFELSVLVTDRLGRPHRAARKVTVLESFP